MVFEELNGVDSECRSYLVADSGQALIVDPLLEKVEAYLARLSALKLRLAYAADTHTHADHLSGSKELSRRTGAKIAGAPKGVAQFPLREGSVLIVGQLTIRVWDSPGHTADSLVFLLPDRVIAGDTLFIGATGRTDLPTGDPEQEWDSVQRLLTLPDGHQIWPGHDYNRRTSSTIGDERRTNNRLLMGREKFLAAMREPRPSKPARLAEALAYNTTPAAPEAGTGTVED
jgi:glyoxylase-like metal-dependent hydrolase (beta-lactamase superfamily II)